MRSKKGFTLIELLVVIAIIAILAAILFPVFATARERARQNNCLSNLKQLSLGLQMYGGDWNQLPPSELSWMPRCCLNNWWGANNQEGTFGAWWLADPQGASNGWLYSPKHIWFPYTRNNGIWECDSDSNTADLAALAAAGKDVNHGRPWACCSSSPNPCDLEPIMGGFKQSMMPYDVASSKARTPKFGWSYQTVCPPIAMDGPFPYTSLPHWSAQGPRGWKQGLASPAAWSWIWDVGHTHNGMFNTAFLDGHAKAYKSGTSPWGDAAVEPKGTVDGNGNLK